MSVTARSSHDVCQVLIEDPDLAETIPPADRGRAIQECTARAANLSPGDLSGQSTGALNNGIGLLVLHGLLIRRVGIDERSAQSYSATETYCDPGKAKTNRQSSHKQRAGECSNQQESRYSTSDSHDESLPTHK